MDTRKDPPTFLTAGAMATRLHVPTTRINYILESRDIPVAAYAGDIKTRLYYWRDLVRVRDELLAIDARRADHREVANVG